MRFSRHMRYVGILLVLLLTGSAAAAQGTLTYGQSVSGSLSATSPLAFYPFQGSQGDTITVQAIAVSTELDLNLTLLSPTQQSLANSSSDPVSGFSGDARLTAQLPQTGLYTLLVGSLGAPEGDFLIRLTRQNTADSSPPTPLSELPASIDFPADSEAQTFIISATADTATLVSIGWDAPFSASIEVRDSSSQVVAFFTGLNPAVISVPAGGGDYQITITPTSTGSAGTVTFSLVSTEETVPAEVPTAVPPPVETPEVAPPVETPEVVPDGDVCTVSSASPVNIRSGPGTNYEVVGQLQPGQSLVAEGQNSGWYMVILPDGGQGWVAASVVATNGPCNNLPTVTVQETVTEDQIEPTAAAPEVPTATYTPSPTTAGDTAGEQPTPTFTPSATTAQDQNPTATYTPSYTPTTPPAAQVAPEDARFNNPLTIQLDSTASVTDFVSYPNGDREDRVRFDISGMNPNASLSGGRARLILAVSCFGTGTQNIQFFTGGQTYSCGQTILDQEVTYDSRTGSVTITAVGGEATYVQWVLTGTATRVN